MYEGQWWGVTVRICQFISLALVVIFNGHILTAVFCFAVIQSTLSFFIFIYVKKKLPEFYPWWKNVEWKTGISNFKKSLILTFNGIAQQSANNGLTLFVATTFQASMVPAFTTIRTITNTAGSITNIFISSLLPDIVRFHATGEDKKLIKTLNANWFISGVMVNFGIVFSLPFIEPIYKIWTKGALEFNWPLYLFLVAGISFSNFGAGLYMYLSGINNLRSQTIITFARVVLVFGVSSLFINKFGIVSIGIGILVSEIVCSVFLPVYFVRLELGRFNNILEMNPVIIGIMPPVVILMISLLCFFVNNIRLLSMAGLILLTVIYILNWRILDETLKLRLKHLINMVRSHYKI
jgi:O-antigen/teichoic acid export membrane protein